MSKKPQDPNRGFKLAVDGRLIIEEPKRGKGRNSGDASDSDDESDTQNLPGAKTSGAFDELDSDDDDDAEDEKILPPKGRKRKASSSMSAVSGKTGTSSKYVAGGKGIHRPLGAESVRSGTASTIHGTEYRSKKAKGDIKKKGKLDPYAYIPLSRNALNKR